MRVGQAKELFRALTQQYFGGANVVFANQSRTAKQKEPLVVLTPGNVHRPQAPNYTFVDGEVVGHYLSRFSITVDLFTNGSPVVDEASGKVVAYEDNAVDDMFILCYEVIKLNFKGFFKRVGIQSGSLIDKLRKGTPTSENGETSTSDASASLS